MVGMGGVRRLGRLVIISVRVELYLMYEGAGEAGVGV